MQGAMRDLVPLGLAAALLTSACEAFGAARGLAIAAVVLTGALAWLAHRGLAIAGGGTIGSSTSDAATTDSSGTDSGTTGSTTVGPDTLDSTASNGTAGSTTTTGTTAAEGSSDVGPCLSVGLPETDTTEPELLPCLCACETDGDRTAGWAPALLLPAIALRRRNRRTSLGRLAAAGRLPPDVIARLRRRLEDDDRAE